MSDIQNFYEAQCKVALIIGALLILTRVLVLPLIEVPPAACLLLWVLPVLISAACSMWVRWKNRDKALRPPMGLSGEHIYFSFVAMVALFVVMIAAHMVAWPGDGPREQGGRYVDKRGRLYSRADFERHRAWELSLMTVWTVGALIGTTALPFRNFRTKEWEFPD